MEVKTTFLNGDLSKEVYMKQPEGFVMPKNKHKVCKLIIHCLGWNKHLNSGIKSLICFLSDGFSLNQSDKCVHRKFDSSSKGIIIFLYVYDMLIFGSDQNQVDNTKQFWSSKFSVKDMGIEIRREQRDCDYTITLYWENSQ